MLSLEEELPLLDDDDEEDVATTLTLTRGDPSCFSVDVGRTDELWLVLLVLLLLLTVTGGSVVGRDVGLN